MNNSLTFEQIIKDSANMERLLHDLKAIALEMQSMKGHQQYMDEMINHLHKENAKLKFLLEDVIHEVGKSTHNIKDKS